MSYPNNPEYWCLCGYVGDDHGMDYCQKCGFDAPPFPLEGGGAEAVCSVCGDNAWESACPECGQLDPFGFWDTGPISQRPAPFTPNTPRRET